MNVNIINVSIAVLFSLCLFLFVIIMMVIMFHPKRNHDAYIATVIIFLWSMLVVYSIYNFINLLMI